MRAVVWHGRRDVRVDEVPDPTIQEPTDAIIEVTSSGICGSDLHLYEVLSMFMEPGDILGHEPMGRVVAVGADTGDLAVGDRVVIPFNISCGHCYMCDRELFAQCETTQVRQFDKGAALYGYTRLYGQVPGGQAELLRVPHAGFGAVKVPEGPPDHRFVFLSDVLPTAWQAVEYAETGPGDTLAVFGLGPIGQMAARVGVLRGARRVIGIDRVPERLAMAARHGVDVLDVTDLGDDEVVAAVRDRTDGRGADGVVDAVGMEAHGSPLAATVQRLAGALPERVAAPLTERFGVDRLGALTNAIAAVRRGGVLSISGVYGGMQDPLPMMTMFDKGLTVRMGQAHVKRWIPAILPHLGEGDPLGTDDLTTDDAPFSEAPALYEKFQKKVDGTVKVVLHPS